MTRKALGRGLSALLREVETATQGLDEVALDRIDPNPLQPRRSFHDAGLKELADSIRASGIVQPVLLRKTDGRYQLVAGERRWRAAKLAGLKSLPAVIRQLSDEDALELALTENLLREELNPLEVARGFEALAQRFTLRHEEIAERLGLDRSTVTNTLRLLKLPEPVQELVAEGRLAMGHARALLGLATAKAQLALARRIAQKGLSVRQVETLVALAARPLQELKVEKPEKIDPNLKAAILAMERALGTKVRVVGTAKRGRIEISYYSGEDLERLYEIITGGR